MHVNMKLTQDDMQRPIIIVEVSLNIAMSEKAYDPKEE